MGFDKKLDPCLRPVEVWCNWLDTTRVPTKKSDSAGSESGFLLFVLNHQPVTRHDVGYTDETAGELRATQRLRERTAANKRELLRENRR